MNNLCFEKGVLLLLLLGILFGFTNEIQAQGTIVKIEDLISENEHKADLDELISILYNESRSTNLALYPDPFDNYLKVSKSSQIQLFGIVITDDQGNVYLSESISGLPVTFTILNMPNGDFNVELDTSQGFIDAWVTKDSN